MNPLHEAAKSGDINKVQELLETGTWDVNERTEFLGFDAYQRDYFENGLTPLHFAAKGGHSDVVALLIQHGADPCSIDEIGRTPLHYAAEGGHSDIAALLIQHGADPCSTDRWGRTPLHEAAKGGHSYAAALLIQHGSDPCSTDKIGKTPLHDAAGGGHSDVAALLIQHGADPCSTDRFGRTPLHYAAWGGHSDVAALLIQHGADHCSTDRIGRTPLYDAVGGGHIDVAALLIQHGADSCSTDWYGSTPLHKAVERGHSDVAALLIQHGADHCGKDMDGRTLLHEAAKGGHSDVAALLIQHGADPCSTDEIGRTPLYDAADGGHSDVAALLIQHGADSCSTDKIGRTPLHKAAGGGHSDVAALLIQHGADPCCLSRRGLRPSGLFGWGNERLATLLKKFENGLVQNFILIMSLEHVASTMNIVEANNLFKDDMSRHFPNGRQHKMLDRLKNWADAYGIKSIQELKRRLAEAGCLNLAAAAAKHYTEIAKEIMDMAAECYETFCQDPMSHRHMISSAVCPTEQRCEISMDTDSYQYDAYLAHHSDDEEVVDEMRGQLESNGVRCCEPPLIGSIKIQSMFESVEKARRTVFIFSKASLGSKSFNLTCNVALSEAEKRKEGVMIPVTTDVDAKCLPPPYDTMQCIPLMSQDFIPKLVDAIKGPRDVPLYGELSDKNENLKRETAALRQQLEDSIALNRSLAAELGVAAAPRQFVREPEGM